MGPPELGAEFEHIVQLLQVRSFAGDRSRREGGGLAVASSARLNSATTSSDWRASERADSAADPPIFC